MAPSRTVVIAGAGIGGLTAALALAAKGFRVVVLEKAERLEEAGAGLQLSPNASRILIDLGLGERLARIATLPDAVSLMSTRAGGEIARLPLGEAASFSAGAPYWVVHRADLQATLAAKANEHPDIDLRLGVQFEDVAFHANGISVGHRSGATRQQEPALALIGADGIWSSVRRQLLPEARPQFSGMVAWRGSVDARQLPRELTAQRVQLWMGANAHLVAYPISGGRTLNLVAVVAGTWNQPGWSTPGATAEIMHHFRAPLWPNAARMMIGAVDRWHRWALFTLADIGRWNSGATALLGDAAHAMLPFAAQGAAMAIEDAAVLAKCLSEGLGESLEHAMPVADALKRYAGQRRSRVMQVRRAAQRAGRIYHLDGAPALARDLVIKALGPHRLLARQDWIYDWKV